MRRMARIRRSTWLWASWGAALGPMGCALISGVGDLQERSPGAGDASYTDVAEDRTTDAHGDATNDSSGDSSMLVDTGGPLTCEGGLTACPGGCSNLASDPANCGRCGRNCRAPCTNGVCQATLLASGQSGPTLPAVAGGQLFWTAGSIQFCSSTDCAQGPQLFASAGSPYGIATDNVNVYWADQAGPVAGCSVRGCAQFRLTYSPSEPTPFEVASNGTTLYWTDSGDDSIHSCPITGCLIAPSVVGGGLGVQGIVADDTTVYWANYGPALTTDAGSTYPNGTIMSCPAAGCAGNPPTVLAQNLPAPRHVRIDASYVYWVERASGGAVKRCARSGCTTPAVLVQANNYGGYDLAVDADNVYFTQEGNLILSCPLAGCAAPAVVADAAPVGGNDAHGITLDATNIYWTDKGDGLIFRAPK